MVRCEVFSRFNLRQVVLSAHSQHQFRHETSLEASVRDRAHRVTSPRSPNSVAATSSALPCEPAFGISKMLTGSLGQPISTTLGPRLPGLRASRCPLCSKDAEGTCLSCSPRLVSRLHLSDSDCL